MNDLTCTVDAYLAFWNATDASERRRLIAEVLTEDATYADPMAQGEGHGGIDAMVAAMQGTFPGHRFTRLGKVDAHGSHLRFSWELASREGAVIARGTDYAQRSGDGRLKAITGFIDHLAKA